MPVFPVLTLQNSPEDSKPMLEQTQQAFNFIPNLIGVMASSPAITEAYLSIANIFSKSGLSATEQQIVLLTVSHFNDCRYCMAAHTAISSMQDIEMEVVQAIRDDIPIIDPKLQALRQFTRLIVENKGWLADADVQTFLEAGYEQSHILDILVGVAQKTLSNYTNHLAKTPLDEPFSAVAWEPEK